MARSHGGRSVIHFKFTLPPEAAVSPSERRVFASLVEGHHRPGEIATHCALTELEVIDALTSLGRQMLVIFRAGRPYFRVGDRFLDSQGTPLDSERAA